MVLVIVIKIITNRKTDLIVYQRPIFGRREGSIGTIIYFYFRIPDLFFFFQIKIKSLKKKKERESVGINDKKILEHNFGRDDGSRSSFWPWY